MRTAWITIAIASSGCVGSGKTQDPNLGQAEAASAGDTLGAGIEQTAQTFGQIMPSPAVDPPCVTVSGNLEDTDQDRIPLSGYVKYACTGMNGGFTATLDGTLVVTDDDPAAAKWAFTGMADMQATFTGPLGGTSVTEWTGDLVATQAGAAGPFGLHREVTATTTITGAAGRSVVIVEDNDWTVTYTPQVTWSPGQLAVMGSLSVDGMWHVDVGDKSADAQLVSAVPLTLDPSCYSRITAGKLIAKYAGPVYGRGITVTWTGCGQRLVEFAEYLPD